MRRMDALFGRKTWAKDLELTRPSWYFSGSPLVLDKTVVFAVGTDGVALDKENGEFAWATGKDACGNASPVTLIHQTPRSTEERGNRKAAASRNVWKR